MRFIPQNSHHLLQKRCASPNQERKPTFFTKQRASGELDVRAAVFGGVPIHGGSWCISRYSGRNDLSTFLHAGKIWYSRFLLMALEMDIVLQCPELAGDFQGKTPERPADWKSATSCAKYGNKGLCYMKLVGFLYKSPIKKSTATHLP